MLHMPSLPKASPALLKKSRFGVSLLRDTCVHFTQQAVSAWPFTLPLGYSCLQCHCWLPALEAGASLFGTPLQEKESPALQFNSGIVDAVSAHLVTDCWGQNHFNFSQICCGLAFGFWFFVVQQAQEATTIEVVSAEPLSLACNYLHPPSQITASF